MPIKPFESDPCVHQQNVREYSRILTAAVISNQFRKMLLDDPCKAISAGFGGEIFHLENEEKIGLASIHAATLADFALELNRIGLRRTASLLPISRT